MPSFEIPLPTEACGGGSASATAPDAATGARANSIGIGKSLSNKRFRKDLNMVHVVPSGLSPGPMVETQSTERRRSETLAPPQCIVRES
mmetsp:Transcript_14987/g.41468  ORF Transcript_14987/g.41468 Transcript_14987/m.41468 type:complete len:89 (+) Transcript_14987:255-521(+)